MPIEQNECIFSLMSLRLALMIVYFLVINRKRCNRRLHVLSKLLSRGWEAAFHGEWTKLLWIATASNVWLCLTFTKPLLNLPSNIYNLNESAILPQIIFNNCKILDKAKHWTLLLFKEALSFHREKPLLNHGTKASKELVIFY